jgi:hypothetical protein
MLVNQAAHGRSLTTLLVIQPSVSEAWDLNGQPFDFP